MKLDKKDFQILKILADNCRTPTGHVAKQIGMSRESTHYRIQRLLEKNVITKFSISVDIQKLGFLQHIIYLSLQRVDNLDEITQKIVENPLVGWTTKTPGKWDLIFDVYTQDMTQLDEFLSNFKKEMKHLISDIEISTQLEIKTYPSKYFGKTDSKKQKIPQKAKVDKAILKPKDLELLKLLSTNARLDLRAISKKIDISFPTLKKRMALLEESGIIMNYTLLFDQEKVGIRRFYPHFNINCDLLEEEGKFIKFLQTHTNVSSYIRPSAQPSIRVGVFANNHLEFRKIMTDIRKKFGHMFKLDRVVIVHAEPKSKIVPEGIFPLLAKEMKFN
ncbi:hypothetical protein CL619_02195 [archaeon]|nr:hypothetical protein [archaeon]|tara:strand:- start:591 stop:1586 length:996 start_codon:yes stop_codon:yes gene_type:complete